MGAAECLTVYRPPCNQIEHRAQVTIDGVTIPAFLKIAPRIPQPQQVLL